MGARSKHFAIAGAGLLGRLLAWQLLRQGHRVTLYEAGEMEPSPSAARTAAGMVAPLSEAVVSERPVYAMGLFAMAQWPRWLSEFDTPGAERFWHQQGSLVVAHPQDVSELTQFEQELRYIVGDAAPYQRLGQAQLQHLEPGLSTGFQEGLWLEQEGHLDNRGLLLHLLIEIQALGGTLRPRQAVEAEPGAIITAEGKRQACDCVLDCRGVGAKPRHAGLRGVRGEVLHVQTDEIQLTRPVRLMHPRYQLYIVPKPKQHFVLGATQIESEDRSPMSLQSSLELGSALYTLSPAFAEARIIEQDVNLRPAFMDNNPHITHQPGLISANGLFRHGYLLAPAVVSQVLGLLNSDGDLPFNEFLLRKTSSAQESPDYDYPEFKQ